MLGVIHLKDIVKDGLRERFAELRAMGIRTVMITGDNPLTAKAIAAEAGVDDYLAEATPEDKLALIRREQEGGNLVAMTGDGTNDAPALAQADVGVAMNTGTSAAKEAGNMVDLDSDPTKLIDIVRIGKQLLITRGALTTFSLANDIAKYFAIIPAMFMGVFPGLAALNIMQLSSPASAVMSAIIFNAIVIVLLIPLALRGVKYRAASASQHPQPQPADLRARRRHRPVHRHQTHRHRREPHPGLLTDPARRTTCITRSTRRGVRRPPRHGGVHSRPRHRVHPARHRDRAAAMPWQSNGSAVARRGRPDVGSALIGQPFTDAEGTPCRTTSSPGRPPRATAMTVARPAAATGDRRTPT